MALMCLHCHRNFEASDPIAITKDGDIIHDYCFNVWARENYLSSDDEYTYFDYLQERVDN